MKLSLFLKAGLLLIAPVAAVLLLAFPFTDANAQITAQQRLKAHRAAKVDALRNLAEIIYGVRIDSRTTVRDFVTQSDTVRAGLDTVIQGAQEIEYVEHHDGTAEVTVEITLGRVEDILGRKLEYYDQTFRATGYGVPSGGSASAPAYQDTGPDTVSAKGYGIEPNDPYMGAAEKALMAKRAAKVDALRNLAEKVYGVRITGDSVVRDFVTQSDDMRARVNTFIQGARVISEQQMPDGSYEAEVGIDIDPLREMLLK